MNRVFSLPSEWAVAHPASGAFGLVFVVILALLVFLLFPYLRNTSSVMSRRAARAVARGSLSYIFGKRGQRRVHGWRALFRLRVETMLRTRKPIRGINRFSPAKVWVDREAFSRIRKLIRRARHTVVIQMFIWKDDRIGRAMAELLCDVADRGVHVSIAKETVGDMFELQQDFLGTRESSATVWKRFWAHENIHVRHEARNDHAKVFIIDDRVLLITGMNIGDEYHDKWHDYLVELRGRRFVERYLTDGDAYGSQSTSKHETVRLVMNTERRREIRPAVMRLLSTARRSIVIEHCYLADPAVIDSVSKRSREGIRIVVILPKDLDVHQYANMQTIGTLLTRADRKYIEIFQYPKMFHGKIILVDRDRAFLGSANLTTPSLDEMGEVNALIAGRSSKAIRKLRDTLRHDVFISKSVSRPPKYQWLWRWLTWFQL